MADEENQTNVVRRALRSLFPVYLSAFLLLVALGLAITFFGDPLAGQPVARLDIQLTTPPPPPAPKAVDSAPDDGLIEQTDLGPLPKTGKNGQTPMQAYAGAAPGPGAKIAIVVSGLGVSAKETDEALSMLPTTITLAFSPYVGDVQRWVVNARSRGHEILVMVPMEPFDYPDNDPGQYALRVDGGQDANIQRLNWSLTRMTGYVGIANLFGERFLTEGSALAPILSYLAKRGLMFFDTGIAPNSKAAQMAASSGIYLARADVRIDAVPASAEIDQCLARLEAQAKSKGVAIGAADLSPVVVERLAKWAPTLAAKGIVLAPISAVASQPK